ncbi:MAG: hypothetical protein LJE89_13425 [Deltaproteobacteria bacterium]|nr:hypothetical protein [Deltaproteobacteria bacterium]
MNKNTNELTITYFPYTFMDEKDLKRLIPYFDKIRLLQVFPDSDPRLPDLLHTSQMVQPYCPISDPVLLETVSRARKTYDQMGRVHRDVGVLHLLQTFALQEDFEDSRTGLVASIRKAHPRLSEGELALVNDAVFILLADQLDQEHAELDLDLERIRGLEAKFHEEVGIGTDEEAEISGTTSVLLPESDPPRSQYIFQRLRAWTRLNCLQEKMVSSPSLTTSPEVSSEIAERLPPQFAALTGEPLTKEPEQHLLSILPDPQSLSLAEVLEFRQLLSRESALDNWRESLTAAFNQLKREPLQGEIRPEIRQSLQEQAHGFQQLWPTSEKPSHCLRLECLCYPNMEPEVAFSLASGLELPPGKIYAPAGTNGITLLFYPSEL